MGDEALPSDGFASMGMNSKRERVSERVGKPGSSLFSAESIAASKVEGHLGPRGPEKLARCKRVCERSAWSGLEYGSRPGRALDYGLTHSPAHSLTRSRI